MVICPEWLPVLLAAKDDEGHQKLVDPKCRGGLWKVNQQVVDIFKSCVVFW